jgi:hypothetical protein
MVLGFCRRRRNEAVETPDENKAVREASKEMQRLYTNHAKDYHNCPPIRYSNNERTRLLTP